jgi:hypothetical protein
MNAKIIRNLSFEEYRALPGMNQSTLKEGLQSAAHMKWAIDHPKPPTAAMALGTAFHVLTTEPDSFAERYLVGGPINPSTGKPYGSDTKKFAEWVAENGAGKAVITQEDYASASAMADAIRRLPGAADILAMPKLDIEIVIQWTDEGTGVLCKCRLDTLLHYTDPIVVLDLKSTQDATRHGFDKSCRKFGYGIQDAMYSEAVAAAFGKGPRFIFACVESSPPYCAAIHELVGEKLALAHRQYHALLRMYAECERCGEWPGYPTGIIQHARVSNWEDDFED